MPAMKRSLFVARVALRKSRGGIIKPCSSCSASNDTDTYALRARNCGNSMDLPVLHAWFSHNEGGNRHIGL